MEHHANLVPWQMLAQERGLHLDVVEVSEDGSLDWESFQEGLNRQPKLVAITYVSNTLGTVNDAHRIVEEAHGAGARVLIDGAQAAPHKRVDVQHLDCDFFVFSGHKTYGPTGIGVLYGKRAVLESMPPWRGGGEMIADVSLERGTTFAPIPFKFEAGTPHISGAIGLGAALDWMQSIGLEVIAAHEASLTAAAHQALSTIPGMRFIGTAPGKAGVVSFIVEGTHPYDLGALLDAQGVAVRTGQHCTQPLLERFGLPGTVRASFAAYNTFEEVEVLHRAVERAVRML
jgi:cysteine desulfurase/selenocysteine lyase